MPPRPVPVAVAVAVAVAVPGAALADEIPGESRVSEVVVFPDRALVTRSATVQLKPGAHEIVVSGIPATLDLETLRARGEGTARVTLGSVDLRKGFRKDALDERIRKLEAQIESLSDGDRELADAEAAAQFEMRYLESIRAKSGEQSSERLLEVADPSSGIAATSDVMVRRLRAAQGEVRRVLVARRDVARQVDALRQELEQLRSGNAEQEVRAVVAVEAQSGGSFTVHLTYQAGWASWVPTYDVRLYEGDGRVSISYGAWVQQGTGEDWGTVALKLSTARPALGIAPPDLPPWVLQPGYYEPAPRRSRAYSVGAGAPAPAAEAEMRMEEKAMDADVVYRAEEVVAAVENVGASVEFAVPGNVSVPGDGTRKRVPVASWSIDKVKANYVAVPELSPYAFLSAKLKNEKDFPLLPGEMQSFLTDRYVGKASLAMVAAGSEFEVAFGVDERVKVKREIVEQESGKKGIFSGKEVVHRHWKTTVENLRKEGIEIEVRDRIPVSENEKIVVKVLDGSTAPTESKERGLRFHRLKLGAGGKQLIELVYEVSFPPEERPWGL